MKKRILSFALAVLMVVACVPAIALGSSAAVIDLSKDIVWYSGKTGAVATKPNDDDPGSYEDIPWFAETEGYMWSFNDGVLTVRGGVAMGNVSKDKWPWHSIRSEITKVVIAPGVTSVGKEAFAGCENLVEVVIGEGCTTLWNDAFAYSDAIETITLPSTITTIKQGVAYSSDGIKTVYISGKTPEEFEASVDFGPYNDIFKVAGGALTTLEYTPITLSPSPFGAWENWQNSPNKGDMDAVTELLVRVTDSEGNNIDGISTTDLTWKLTFIAGGDSKTVTMAPATTIDGYGTYRFEPCLGTGENQFVPAKNVNYSVAIEIYEGDTLKYKSLPATGFKLGVDPVVPNGEAPTLLITNPVGYIEADLGSAMPVNSVKVVNYVSSIRYYKWSVFATNDKTLPISEWTLIGGKFNEDVSTDAGYTAKMEINEENAYDEYQYIRIYGTMNSSNYGYHYADVYVTAMVSGNSHVITWVVDDTTTTTLVEEGTLPVYDGTPSKAPTYTEQYTFTGWDKEIVAATGAATYTAQFEESERPARTITVGDGWFGMENWNWGGVEKQTQLLLSIDSADDPTFNNGKDIVANDFRNYRWEITFIWEEDGAEQTKTCVMTPWSTIVSDMDYRVRVTSGPDAFLPENGVEYRIGLKLYDVTLEGYGSEGYLAYQGVSTNTVSLGEDPMYNDANVSQDDLCTITWQLEGETIYTAEVLANKGIVPSYPGTPIAGSKWVDGKRYVLKVPAIAAATGDATYNMTYEQDTELKLGVYNNMTWENWDEDTQLLIQIYDSTGATTPDLWANRANFVWKVVIDGVEYECAPDSSYIDGNFSIYRFEIAKDGTFVPEAGANYTIGVKLYDANGEVAFESSNTLASSVPEGFVPIVDTVEGDVNGDGGVTIADVAAALDMIAGKADVTDFADINGDGGVSIADVAAILDIIAGK